MVLVKTWQLFDLFNIGKKGKENEFKIILQGKKAFSDNKSNKLKKSKNWDFFKGVSQKLAMFLSV